MTNEIIKFLTAGSVDDGKSTLLGRLLYDSDSLYQDQIDEVIKSTDQSFEKGDIDFSLFLDGLISERTQKITIDVAYRYFSFDQQKFIIADAPGHEQYTKNMAVAAANSDIAVILIDAKKGVRPQTIRHSHIANLFGIKNIIIAINKMDLIGYDPQIFNLITNEYLRRIKDLSFDNIHFVPISAAFGENIIHKSKNIPWYRGKTIIEYLLQINSAKKFSANALRLQVQNIIKHEDKRYYQTFLSAGKLAINDEVKFYPQKKSAKISEIIYSGNNVDSIENNASLSIVIDREIDVNRGDLIVTDNKVPYFENHLNAYLLWFSEGEFKVENDVEYLIKINHNYVRALIKKINYLVNILDEQNSDKSVIRQNQIVHITISLSQNIAFDSFKNNHQTGSFLLIDKNSNETLAIGIIDQTGDDEEKASPKLFSILKNYFPNILHL